ncbi:MAG TPA: MFS transporter [Acidimicrobiales bacterium]|nr:MFS transporter [Acidimicrobiales bacterium]
MDRDTGSGWGTLVTVALGVIMVGVDGTVVSIANPAIARSLGASLSDLQWITNAYLLALAVSLIPGGKLGDRFGRRLLFLVGVGGFALSSVGVAVAGSVGGVVAMRTLQGVFGGILMPNTLALLRAAFPGDRFNRAVGIWSASSGAAIAGGPVVGGLLVEHVSWQSVFFVNVPIGAAAMVSGLLVMPESRESVRGRFDVPGLVLLAAALFCLVFGIVQSENLGWGDPVVLVLLAAAVVLGAGFVAVERRAGTPLVPLHLLAQSSIALGVVTLLLTFAALYGIAFFTSLYLQNVLGLDPVAAGVRLLPLIGLFSVTSPFAGRAVGRYGPRVPITAGLLLVTVALAALLGLGVASPFWALAVPLAAMGLGVALVVVASTEAIVAAAPVDEAGLAGGLQGLAGQLGGVLGSSVLGSVLAVRVGRALSGALAARGVPPSVAARVAAHRDLVDQGAVPAAGSAHWHQAVAAASHDAFVSGLHLALLVAAAATLVGAACGPFVRTPDGGDAVDRPVPVHF